MEIQMLIHGFETALKSSWEEIHDLVLRYRPLLSRAFAYNVLRKTRYHGTNQLYDIGERYVFGSPLAPWGQEEIMDYNMKAQGYQFTQRPDLDRSYKRCAPPLNWIQCQDGATAELFLAEEKLGPFPSSSNLKGKNDDENLRSVYGLIKLSNAVPKCNNVSDDGNVLYPRSIDPRDNDPETHLALNILTCHGYIPQGLNEPLKMVWGYPDPKSLCGNSDSPKMTTLLEVIDQDNINAARRNIAVNLINSVYTLLEARWYHKNLCLNNIISFNDDWSKPYMVGFRTARSAVDGLSDPLDRPDYDWIDRYYQHPERYDGKKARDVHFVMKHDIYGLGIILLELWKGYQLASKAEVVTRFSNIKEHKYLPALEKFARAGEGRLGKDFIEPIICCLRGFEGVAYGFDDPESQMETLSEFKRRVLDKVGGRDAVGAAEGESFAVGEASGIV